MIDQTCDLPSRRVLNATIRTSRFSDDYLDISLSWRKELFYDIDNPNRTLENKQDVKQYDEFFNELLDAYYKGLIESPDIVRITRYFFSKNYSNKDNFILKPIASKIFAQTLVFYASQDPIKDHINIPPLHHTDERAPYLKPKNSYQSIFTNLLAGNKKISEQSFLYKIIEKNNFMKMMESEASQSIQQEKSALCNYLNKKNKNTVCRREESEDRYWGFKKDVDDFFRTRIKEIEEKIHKYEKFSGDPYEKEKKDLEIFRKEANEFIDTTFALESHERTVKRLDKFGGDEKRIDNYNRFICMGSMHTCEKIAKRIKAVEDSFKENKISLGVRVVLIKGKIDRNEGIDFKQALQDLNCQKKKINGYNVDDRDKPKGMSHKVFIEVGVEIDKIEIEVNKKIKQASQANIKAVKNRIKVVYKTLKRMNDGKNSLSGEIEGLNNIAVEITKRSKDMALYDGGDDFFNNKEKEKYSERLDKVERQLLAKKQQALVEAIECRLNDMALLVKAVENDFNVNNKDDLGQTVRLLNDALSGERELLEFLKEAKDGCREVVNFGGNKLKELAQEKITIESKLKFMRETNRINRITMRDNRFLLKDKINFIKNKFPDKYHSLVLSLRGARTLVEDGRELEELNKTFDAFPKNYVSNNVKNSFLSSLAEISSSVSRKESIIKNKIREGQNERIRIVARKIKKIRNDLKPIVNKSLEEVKGLNNIVVSLTKKVRQVKADQDGKIYFNQEGQEIVLKQLEAMENAIHLKVKNTYQALVNKFEKRLNEMRVSITLIEKEFGDNLDNEEEGLKKILENATISLNEENAILKDLKEEETFNGRSIEQANKKLKALIVRSDGIDGEFKGIREIDERNRGAVREKLLVTKKKVDSVKHQFPEAYHDVVLDSEGSRTISDDEERRDGLQQISQYKKIEKEKNTVLVEAKECNDSVDKENKKIKKTMMVNLVKGIIDKVLNHKNRRWGRDLTSKKEKQLQGLKSKVVEVVDRVLSENREADLLKDGNEQDFLKDGNEQDFLDKVMGSSVGITCHLGEDRGCFSCQRNDSNENDDMDEENISLKKVINEHTYKFHFFGRTTSADDVVNYLKYDAPEAFRGCSF